MSLLTFSNQSFSLGHLLLDHHYHQLVENIQINQILLRLVWLVEMTFDTTTTYTGTKGQVVRVMEG